MRKNPLKSWPLLFLLSGILLLSALIPPVHEGLFSLCLFRNIFGFPCPGCGMTRAFLFIGHGDLSEAIRMNPGSLPAFLLVALLWFHSVLRVLLKREIKIHFTKLEIILMIVVSVSVMIASWIYNLTRNPWV